MAYFHGGGLSVGSPDLVLAPARAFASDMSCVVACPSLNQLPEYPFPEPVRIAWEVCAWLSDAENLNDVLDGTIVDPVQGFVVGGLSSGGAAAAVIASISSLLSNPESNVSEFSGLTPLQAPITGIFSGIPFLATEDMLPAEYQDMFKSRENEDEASSAMRLDLESRLAVHSPWFSPLNFDVVTQKHHPPKVFVYGGERDQFRDDSLIYAKWLEQLKVEVRTTVLEGEGHMAWLSLPWPACHGDRMKKTTMDGMAWLLNQSI